MIQHHQQGPPSTVRLTPPSLIRRLAIVGVLIISALFFAALADAAMDGQHEWRCAHHVTSEPLCGAR